MYMIRNPWGVTSWEGDWSYSDSNWNSNFKSQVPFSVDPTNRSQTVDDGIIIMEDKDFLRCFDDWQIGHYRQSEGYKDTWYDRDGVFETIFHAYPKYFVDVPAKSGDLYFTTETYYYNSVSTGCHTLADAPMMNMMIYQKHASNNTETLYVDHYYYDYFNLPIII